LAGHRAETGSAKTLSNNSFKKGGGAGRRIRMWSNRNGSKMGGCREVRNGRGKSIREEVRV
jgi:hypothetical protein